MNTERAQVGWGFGVRWVLATAVPPFVVAAVVERLVLGASVGGGWLDGMLELFLGVLLGVPLILAWMVIAQWRVLEREFSRPGRWVKASIVGLAVGIAVAVAVAVAVLGPVVGVVGQGWGGLVIGIVGAAVVGASIGIAQRRVLRREFSRAGWWVLASIVAIVAGTGVGAAVGVTVAIYGAISVGFAVGGAIYGAITGGVLVWLLRQPVTEEPSPSQDAA